MWIWLLCFKAVDMGILEVEFVAVKPIQRWCYKDQVYDLIEFWHIVEFSFNRKTFQILGTLVKDLKLTAVRYKLTHLYITYDIEFIIENSLALFRLRKVDFVLS